MAGRLNVVFLWHMHQPYYRDPLTGRYAMPWVRLHGIKDYYDMPNILREFPRIRQTFNLVPSLIDQIQDYADGTATGVYLEHSLKPAAELEPGEKSFILSNFFLANWDNMIKPYPRYWELLSKRGREVPHGDLDRITRYFTDQDFLDLQVWFNLAWFDPSFRDNDPLLKDLVARGRDFSEDEKFQLIEKQREIMRMIIPEYGALWADGNIEVSVSPYYHPILPLLCDTESAREASPEAMLPRRFSHREDAREQVRRALARCEEVFGRRPVGMWPSEGSVSEDIIPILAEEGVKWIATDEQVLAESLGVRLERDYYGLAKDPETLYRPYSALKGDSELNVVFRDHTLSDLIGFVYSNWDPKNAVEDFSGRLKKISRELKSRGTDGLVSIILDGENAWEHYRNDGRDFLYRFYERLSEMDEVEIDTVGGYLEKNPPKERLPKLFAGSWINHNFNIWIGHEEDNAAWDALSDARAALASHESSPGEKDPDSLKMAWEEIYIAEGSDWCWWYGDDHSSENDREFDELFRMHLRNVYTLIGQDPPGSLLIPIIREDRKTRPTVELTAFISPTLDGEVTSYFEWLAAAYYDVRHYGGTMHRAESVITHIYYGFDLANMFLRLDSGRSFTDEGVSELVFCIHFLKPKPYRIEIEIDPEKGDVSAVMLGCAGAGAAVSCERLTSIAAKDIIETAIPFERIGAKPGDEVELFCTVRRGDTELEKWPYRGYISFVVPNEDFEAIMWHV